MCLLLSLIFIIIIIIIWTNQHSSFEIKNIIPINGIHVPLSVGTLMVIRDSLHGEDSGLNPVLFILL